MNLIEKYEDAVNGIIAEFKKKHGIEENEGSWIAGQVGEIYDFGDTMIFSFNDILSDIKESAPVDEILKWRDYMNRIWAINNMVGGVVLNEISYRKWIMGENRVSDEELGKIELKWRTLVGEIEELGKKQGNSNVQR